MNKLKISFDITKRCGMEITVTEQVETMEDLIEIVSEVFNLDKIDLSSEDGTLTLTLMNGDEVRVYVGEVLLNNFEIDEDDALAIIG